MLAPNGLVCLVIVGGVIAANVDVRYLFENSQPEAKDLNCENEVLRLYCNTRCGGNHACLFGKCFCVQTKGDDQKDPVQKSAQKEEFFLDFDDYTETPALMLADTFPERPALRHHIAHFCPNLEEARKCIKSCMQLGKPAFCGKDHVCYCGHKSETPEGDNKVDVQAIYAQFRDLYKKYFGDPDYDYSREYDYKQ